MSDPTLRRDVHRLLGRAAWVSAAQDGALDAPELMDEAHRSLRTGDLKLAAKASLLARDLWKGDADTGASAGALLALGPEVLAECPELRDPLDRALRRGWLGRVRAAPRQGARRGGSSSTPLGRVRALADESARARAVERALRRQVALTLREEGHGRDALDVLRALAPREHAEEARSHEVLGQLGEASVAWEAAGDAESALRCARELPDLDRALALATRAGSGDAAALRWACELRDLLSGRRAEADGLNDHERGALARTFDDCCPRAAGRADGAADAGGRGVRSSEPPTPPWQHSPQTRSSSSATTSSPPSPTAAWARPGRASTRASRGAACSSRCSTARGRRAQGPSRGCGRCLRMFRHPGRSRDRPRGARGSPFVVHDLPRLGSLATPARPPPRGRGRAAPRQGRPRSWRASPGGAGQPRRARGPGARRPCGRARCSSPTTWIRRRRCSSTPACATSRATPRRRRRAPPPRAASRPSSSRARPWCRAPTPSRWGSWCWRSCAPAAGVTAGPARYLGRPDVPDAVWDVLLLATRLPVIERPSVAAFADLLAPAWTAPPVAEPTCASAIPPLAPLRPRPTSPPPPPR
ncbi:MAG: hypothetical protein IPF99_30880 [Deltaproteobacteria bacterium]|nr:hypothetical protein [Deltaproteobacteria bacterium]